MEYVNAKRSINAAKRSLIPGQGIGRESYGEHYPIIRCQSGEVVEYRLEMERESSGICRELVLSGFWIQISNLHLSRKLCLHSEKRQDVYQMHFSLSGQNQTGSGDFYFDINSGTGNFLFLPKHLPDYPEHGMTSDFINFEINFSPDYFHKQFAGFSALHPNFFNRANKGEAVLLSNNGLTMLPKMKQIVADILHCQLKAPFNKIYLEAKVYELLVLQMEQFGQQKQLKHKLNQTDRTKLALVKDMLISKKTTTSLHELSLESGLNLDKLKKGFKALYGTTVFGYLNDIKMEEARQRLLSMDTTVSEVAEKAGYKNPQHFTTAFKRKYGVLPRDMKQ